MRRFTTAGAIASVLLGNLTLHLIGIRYDADAGGFMPVFWGVLAASAAAVIVSVLTKPSPTSLTARAFGDD